MDEFPGRSLSGEDLPASTPDDRTIGLLGEHRALRAAFLPKSSAKTWLRVKIPADRAEFEGMHKLKSFAGRPYRRLLLSGVLGATAVASLAALAPAGAQAWAWSDTCIALVSNHSGSQGSVRPVFYAPVLPSASGEASYATFAIVGIPTTGMIPFSNSGYPVPSYGCHAALTFVNPGPNVACAYSAPTTGANHFSCDGNARVKVIQDDDDIVGEVHIAEGRGGSSLTPPSPRVGSNALRVLRLRGAGWTRSEQITSFGLAGRAMAADTLPAICDSRGGEATPKAVQSEELVRDDGNQGVGAVVQSYANSTQSAKTESDALSPYSIGCLARLLTSRLLDTSVTTQSLRVSALGDGVEGSQLKIRQSSTGQVDYLDVLGVTDGNQDAIELIEHANTAPTAGSLRTDLAALRIRG
jgi:hypothetical protein